MSYFLEALLKDDLVNKTPNTYNHDHDCQHNVPHTYIRYCCHKISSNFFFQIIDSDIKTTSNIYTECIK